MKGDVFDTGHTSLLRTILVILLAVELVLRNLMNTSVTVQNLKKLIRIACESRSYWMHVPT